MSDASTDKSLLGPLPVTPPRVEVTVKLGDGGDADPETGPLTVIVVKEGGFDKEAADE